MTENFPCWTSNINLQIQDAKWKPNKINPKKSKPRHITVKFLKSKDKEKNTEIREITPNLKGETVTTVDFSS